MAFAAGASLLLHVLLVLLTPAHFQTPQILLLRPLEVQRSTATVPDSRLAPSMRQIPIETNAQANRAAPILPTPYVAARNQRAAQPVPEKAPTKSFLPASPGKEETALRVAQGIPKSQEEAAKMSTEGQPGTASAVAGLMPKVGQTTKPSPALAPAVDTDHPRVRAAPAGTTGMLLRRNTGVNQAGMVAVDARFSNYGDYAQRMSEAIQSTWWDILFRARIPNYETGTVLVRFKLHRDGAVTDLTVMQTSVPTMQTFACKDAISACAPFDVWRPDMVALFGEVDVVTLRFNYY